MGASLFVMSRLIYSDLSLNSSPASSSDFVDVSKAKFDQMDVVRAS